MTSTSLLALAVLMLAPAARAQDVINFDAFPSPPPRTSLAPLFLANNNNRTFDSVTFPQSALVIGDQAANTGQANSQPYVMPHSGNYTFGSGNVQTTTLTTSKTLYGLYLGKINSAQAPEPSQFAAFAVGLLGLCINLRAKRRRTA